MIDTVETPLPADAAHTARRPWIRPTLQLLSANEAEANSGSAGDMAPCPGADKRSKPTCS